MRRTTSIKLLTALVAAFLAAAAPAEIAPDETPSPIPARLPSEMPRSATALNGLLEVFAQDVPGDPMGFRLPILGFASRTIRDIEDCHKLEMPRNPNAGIIIYALDGTTNDTRVIARQFRRKNGKLAVRIWLPSPGFSDLEQLRFEIAKAYFALWIDRNATRPARNGESPALPDWLVQGAVRATDPALAEADAYAVLELWSAARLPFFPALCTDLRYSRGKAAVLSGYIASWVRQKRLLKPALDRLAAGEAWDGARLAADLTGETDPAAQDRASDERLARLARSVLSPGRATRWDIVTFMSRLLLYPREFDKKKGTNRFPCDFRKATELADSSEPVRLAAGLKSREMLLCAIGRGDALAAAATAYRQFLMLLAENAPRERLTAALNLADAIMEKILNEEDRKNDNR